MGTGEHRWSEHHGLARPVPQDGSPPQPASGENVDPVIPAAPRIGVPEAAVAVAAAVLLLVGIVTVVVRATEPHGEILALSSTLPSTSATTELIDEPWGTSVTLEVTGLEPGVTYVARVRGADGDLVQAGTFVGAPGRVTIRLGAAVPHEAVTGFLVAELGGDVVLSAERASGDVE